MFKYALLFVVLFATQLGGVFAWVRTWEVEVAAEDMYCTVDDQYVVTATTQEEEPLVGEATFIPEPEVVQVANVAAAPEPEKVETPKASVPEAQKEVDTMKVVMLEFSASWCKYCKLMEPNVKKVKRKGYEILTLDFDKEVNKKYVDKYKIKVLPTCVIVDAAGKELVRKVGFCTEENLEALFRKVKNP